MIRKCPRCDEPIPWRHRIRGRIWPCGSCGVRLSRLEPDPKSADTIAWLAISLSLLLGAGFVLAVGGLSEALSLAVIPGFVLLLFVLGSALQIALQRCAIDGPHCPVCGYDLAGNAAGTCPECGGPGRQGRDGPEPMPRRRASREDAPSPGD